MLGMAAQWVWVAAWHSWFRWSAGLRRCSDGAWSAQLVYPLCTLILMIAPPTFIFERLTLSLQLLASRLGEVCLEALGYSVLREGNILEMVGIKLSVEEACSGIRSLVAIFFMCVLYNYFFVQGRSMQALLLAMAIPVAILGNAVRIVATGVASQYNPALVSGAAHEAFGYVSVVAAALGVVGVASDAAVHCQNLAGSSCLNPKLFASARLRSVRGGLPDPGVSGQRLAHAQDR